MSDFDGQNMLTPGMSFGDYTVEGLLGKGGMGAVYLLRSPSDEAYAAKIMFPDAAKKKDFRKRFLREAEIAMSMRHKNLVFVYDVGEDPDTGLCYMIMEYVSGGSLADRIKRSGSIPMPKAFSIISQIAMALEVAHRRGVVHRDIKPDNILFTVDGVPKLADLGVARFVNQKTTVTTTNMIVGTPAYMSPEQMMDSRSVDARSDIYSLGIVLYEMLAGKRPNEGCTMVELMAKAIKGEPLPNIRNYKPAIPEEVAYALTLLCATKPEDRPPTALAAVELLRKAASRNIALPGSLSREGGGFKPWHLMAACAVGAMAIGTVVFAFYKMQGIAKPHSNVIDAPNAEAPTNGVESAAREDTRPPENGASAVEAPTNDVPKVEAPTDDAPNAEAPTNGVESAARECTRPPVNGASAVEAPTNDAPKVEVPTNTPTNEDADRKKAEEERRKREAEKEARRKREERFKRSWKQAYEECIEARNLAIDFEANKFAKREFEDADSGFALATNGVAVATDERRAELLKSLFKAKTLFENARAAAVENAKPVISIVATLNGVEKRAVIVKGFLDPDYSTTPRDFRLDERSIGKDWDIVLEYSEGGIDYTGQCTCHVKKGRQVIDVRLEPFVLPPNIKYCKHCGELLEESMRRSKKCPNCRKNLLY